MKSQRNKLLVAGTFLVLFFGSALFMYFKFIHNKPRVKMKVHRTEVNHHEFDSAMKANAKKNNESDRLNQ